MFRWYERLRNLVLEKILSTLKQNDPEYFYHRPITVIVLEVRPMDTVRTLSPAETRLLINANYDLSSQEQLFALIKENLERESPVPFLSVTMTTKV